MSKKKFIIVCILLLVASILLTMGTYSYFTTKVTGTATLVTASWSFKANGETTSFTTPLGDLYPGINRSFDIRLSAVGSEVPVVYTVRFNNPHNISSNLKFYRDSGKQSEINLSGDTVSGTLGAGAETVITIYYDWPYGSTAESYVPGDAWFNMTVSGHQKDPSEGA